MHGEQPSRRPRIALAVFLVILCLIGVWNALDSGPSPVPSPVADAASPPETPEPVVERERPGRRRETASAKSDRAAEVEVPAVEEEPSQPATPAEFTVHVLDEDGSPIPGAVIRRQAGPTVTCDANGAATVVGAARMAGSVLIRLPFRAEAPGYVRSDWVRLGPSAGRPSEIRLQRSFIVEGVVVSAGDQTPVPRAQVTVHAGAGSSVGADPPLGRTITDSGGNFRLDGMPLGDRVTVFVVAEGHATLREALTLPTRAEDTLRLEVHRAGTLVGRVWLPSGDPAAKATVYLVPEDKPTLLPVAESGARMMGRPDWLAARTDAEGRFTLRGMRADRRYIAVAVRADVTPSLRSDPLDPSALPASMDLHLRPGGSIVIDVTASGELPEDLAVFLGQSGVKRGTAVRRSDGRWLLESVPAGEKRFHVKATGFATYEGSVVVESGTTVEVRAELLPADSPR